MSDMGTDWAVERIVRVVDGDTVRLVRKRIVGITDGLEFSVRDASEDGISVRLVNLDTPERGQEGYVDARRDLAKWVGDRSWPNGEGTDLRVITYPGGGFDRLLGDIYVEGDIGDTASQHMLRDRGWQPYVKGK